MLPFLIPQVSIWGWGCGSKWQRACPVYPELGLTAPPPSTARTCTVAITVIPAIWRDTLENLKFKVILSYETHLENNRAGQTNSFCLNLKNQEGKMDLSRISLGVTARFPKADSGRVSLSTGPHLPLFPTDTASTSLRILGLKGRLVFPEHLFSLPSLFYPSLKPQVKLQRKKSDG